MNTSETSAAPETGRKPRLALMGEFSAGKSTLSNLLIGASPLPVKVTATRLPPVWIQHGEADPYRIDLDGNAHPVDLEALDAVPLDETMVVKLFHASPVLELCDLIDMPGISDPNMSSEVWQRMIDKADGVIWCTHATQAWRQSEAAVWEGLSDELGDNSLLLLTRIDKLHTQKERRRVMLRVERETDGVFAGRFPISLTGALAAKDDPDAWIESGADAFFAELVDLVQALRVKLGAEAEVLPFPGPLALPSPTMAARPEEPEEEPGPANALVPRIAPKRVTPKATGARTLKRPPRRNPNAGAIAPPPIQSDA